MLLSLAFPLLFRPNAARDGAAGGGGGTTTWNPADIGTRVALSGGDLIATNNGSTGAAMVRSISSQTSGKYYWEITIGSSQTNSLAIGIADSTQPLSTSFLGGGVHGAGYFGAGAVSFNSATAQTIMTFTAGDIIGVAIDIGNKGIWFRKNGGNWNNNASADPVTNTLTITNSTAWGGGGAFWTGPLFACVDVEKGTATVDSCTANFGATAFANTAPSGFGNL